MAQIDKPGLHFNTKLYTGDGSSSRSITGVGFQPDWLWVKERSSTSSHQLADAVRGAYGRLQADNTNAESVDSSPYNDFKSFDSDGWSMGNGGAINENSQTYVAWNWKANGAGSSNSDGSITSSVSANTTNGFSIVSYTGTAANATVGHGLGSAPNVIFFKSRGNASTNWYVYHSSLGHGTRITLNSTGASASDTEYMNNTAPTNSVFSLGANGTTNPSTTQIAYCFAEKKGYSKFGSYTGNGQANDGTFVYTGFAPAWVMIKRTDSTSQWCIIDNKRPGYNIAVNTLFANSNAVEATDLGVNLLSNGFKEDTTNNLGANGGTYIYMAFAENPIVGSNNIPAVGQ